MRVYAVFGEDDREIIQALQQMGLNVEWKTSFEEAQKDPPDAVDLVLVSEFTPAYSDSEDPDDIVTIRSLAEIIKTVPATARILFMVAKQSDLIDKVSQQFAERVELVAVGESFTVQQLREWILTTRSKPQKPRLTAINRPTEEQYREKLNVVPVTDTQKPVKDNKIRILAAVEQEAITLALREIEQVERVDLASDTDSILPLVHKLKVDLVILSVYLPGNTDFLDVLESLHAMRIKTIFLAGEFGPDDLAIRRLKGKVEIIHGPVRLGALQELVKALCSVSLPDHNSSYQSTSNQLFAKQSGTRPANGLLRIVEDLEKKEIKQESRVTNKLSAQERIPELPQDVSERIPEIPVFAVWSPSASGKTFVSINLASLGARLGMKTLLVNLAPGGEHWLGLDPGGLDHFIRGNSLVESWIQPRLLPKLHVLTSAEKEKVTDMVILQILQEAAASNQVDLVIIDMPSQLDFSTKSIFGLADRVVVVADQDRARLLQFRKAITNVDLTKAVLVVNRYLDDLGKEMVFNTLNWMPDCLIPDNPREVSRGIAEGIPIILCDQIIRQSINQLANSLGMTGAKKGV